MTTEDGVQDMTVLSNIDEHGINTNLRVRYENDRIYTYTGTILVAVNPYKLLPIYETEWVFFYNGQGQKMSCQEPHIFAIAEAAYSSLQSDDKNQACVISGESGAGKTESTKFILQYLCTVTPNYSTLMEHQILEANTILEAFGNAKTVRNDNSSRFGKFIQVCFDSRYQIKGCIIQDYLLEQSRITFQSKGERNYHVFYQLVATAAANSEFRSQFLVEKAENYAYLSQSGCYQIDGVDDCEAFDLLRMAMALLNMAPEMCDGIFSVLSAILWLGNIVFEDYQDGERCKLKAEDEEVLATVATLLGLDAVRLTQAALQRQINVRGNITEIPFKIHEARENRHAMAKALYSRTFSWIVNLINACTSPDPDSKTRFFGVLDIFGFENFANNSFEQLCINYANEKLHRFFNHYVFALEQEMYRQEGIAFSHINFIDNTPCLELLEKPPKCVFRLLTEECRIPKGSDTTYVNKLHTEFESHPCYLRGEDRRNWGLEFGIRHYAGEVIYKVDSFLDKNKDTQQDQLFDLMADSTNIFVKDLVRYREDLYGTTPRTWTIQRNGGGNQTLPTATSKGRPTVADAFRLQLTALVDLLHSTNPWYVRCIKPNTQKAANCYDDNQVLTQLQYLGMLDIIRIRREGYPIHFTFDDFLHRYKCLMRDISGNRSSELSKLKSSEGCLSLLKTLKMCDKEWQIGKSRVFLRASVHEPLEEQRRFILNEMANRIQARWRCYVAVTAYLRLRTSAITIQRYFRGHRQKLEFLRRKRAAITIQSYVRGMFAREVAAAMHQMKKVEEDERKREQEEAEVEARRQLELAEQKDLPISTMEPSPSPSASSINTTGSFVSNETVKREFDESIILPPHKVEKLTKIMEQTGLMNKPASCNASLASHSSDHSSLGATTSSSSIGSTSDLNYADLDKVFNFLSDMAQDKISSDDINRQFDLIIESARANANQLENLKINSSGSRKSTDDNTSQSIMRDNDAKIPSHSLPVPPNATKPMQEVAPMHVNGVSLDKNGNRTDSNLAYNHHILCNKLNSLHDSSPLPQFPISGQHSPANGMGNNYLYRNGLPENMSHLIDRRKQRVDRKISQLQEQQQLQSRESEKSRQSMNEITNEDMMNELRYFDMVEFANKFFNSHTRDFGTGNSVMRTLTRRKKSSDEDILSKQEMLTWTPTTAIPTSHIHMHDPENVLLSCGIFKDICKYLTHNLKTETEIKVIQSIVAKGIEREELRDEIFVQLVRQSTNNPSRDETLKAWILLGLTSAAFHASKTFSKYFQAFLRKNLRKENAISCYAQFCLDNFNPKSLVQASRRFPPSSMEINAVKNLGSLVCRFYFLDGRTKAIDVHPCDTASDAMMCLANRIGLKNLDGWAIYESTPEYEKVIRAYDYIADVISQWESNQKNSIYGSKYGTIGKSSGTLGNGEYRFIFKKRLFRNTKDIISNDDVEISLLFAQAVDSAVKRDEFPLSEGIALRLAGYQAQAWLGEFKELPSPDKYQDITNFISARIRKARPQWTNRDWAQKIMDSHREHGRGKSDLHAKLWYLSTVMEYDRYYGTTFFPVSYKGYLPYGQNLLLGINCSGILLVNPTDKSIVTASPYKFVESMTVYTESFISFKTITKATGPNVTEEHQYFTFETKQKDEIAALITSYCPSLNGWLRRGGANQFIGNGHQNNQQQRQVSERNHINNMANHQVPTRRLLKLSLEDRMKFYHEVTNCRKLLINSGILRKFLEGNLGFVRNTLRKFNKAKYEKMRSEYGGEFEMECFRHFPQSFWAYSKSPLQQSILVISDPELEMAAINNFNAILAYSGLTLNPDLNKNCEQDTTDWIRVTEESQIRLAQNIVDRCVRKDVSDIFKNEFFLQLIKQTTDHPEPNSKVNIRHWQLLSLSCSVTYPTDRRVLSYLHSHLRKCSLDETNEEGHFAKFALRNLQGTLETRGRKMTPSRTEIACTIKRHRIYARIHFLDGQSQAVEFDSCATIQEVIEQIQLKIGLRPNCPGYALYQNLGSSSEQALQPSEKVGDAIAYWERWHDEQIKMNLNSGSNSTDASSLRKTHYFIFKKHLFLDSFINLTDPVERELLFLQIVFNIRQDRFPISEQEAIMLCALKAQLELGDYDEGIRDYRQNILQCLPPRLMLLISPEAVVTQHQSLRGMDSDTAKQSFFNLIKSWPLYRATLFEVTQTYTSSWPRNVWLAIDQTGMHILELKTRNVLTSCDYRTMVDYTPSTNSLMIVAMGKKHIFLTHQAVQIARLIRDYTTVLAQERGVGRRKSVEFDLIPRIQRGGGPPVPPPRPSLQQRQQMMEQSLYQNQNISSSSPHRVHYNGSAQQNGNGNMMHAHNHSHQSFQPTHRRSRPLSILYKPPPVIMTEVETI
ncbi:unconventional myosin 81F isoform X3 [Brevipalpus obovatus]|uniref:unconventional myosin 81F isoform X3 n=1 Tax=Brevipalpus obovatus TaxID=246614 RepID=UPI003D9EFC82